MDAKVRNKVAEIQWALEQDEQRISLSDPVAKMMLVALAHQSCEIERKMEQTVARLSERFCDQVLLRSNLKAQPAVTVLSIGNGRECAPYFIDENDAFAYKPAKCNYRPIFKTRIIPGRLVACFMCDTLLQPGKPPLRATWPDKRHKDEVWLAFDAAGEVNTLEDAIIAFSHPLPSDTLFAEVGDAQIPLSLVMEDTPRALNSNFMLMEFWKKSLVYYGLWLYRFGQCSNKRTLHRSEIPAWIMDAYAQDIIEPLIGNRYLWIRIKSAQGISLPLDTAILLNAIPAVNYDIQDAKLSYSEPIQRLENDKTSTFFLDVAQNQEQAQEFFIRDFDVSQYDNERIREDITNLYHHYVDDYFAFVDSNSLHDGASHYLFHYQWRAWKSPKAWREINLDKCRRRRCRGSDKCQWRPKQGRGRKDAQRTGKAYREQQRPAVYQNGLAAILQDGVHARIWRGGYGLLQHIPV